MSRSSLPDGIVTFLMTDVEASTRRWESEPDAMAKAMALHDDIIEGAAAAHGGWVVKPRGEGDSRFLVFDAPTNAIVASVAVQRAFAAARWPTVAPIRTRIAIHTGPADLHHGDYYGPTVNRCARIRAIIHGGQIVVSDTAAAALDSAALPEVQSRDLGLHRLKDLSRPEQLRQIVATGITLDFPPLTSLTAVSNNLPLQTSSFIGRDRESREVRALLSQGRLVTLTGAGGSGKTRLAVNVAADSVDRFPDGVCFVELAELATSQQIYTAIASVVGAHEVEAEAIIDKLVTALRPRRVLLILDTCEHLLGDVAALITVLLRGCAALHVIATSRERLAVDGEQIYQVPSLALPTLHGDPPLPDLLACESMRLFIDRAKAVDPAFVPTAANAPAIAQICHQLDGIPLAIELAAARARTLAPAQIAQRLDDRFRLLTGGSRAALPRHQTLRALVDWSHTLLEAREQIAFRRLGVFSGGFSLEAAEKVCAGNGVEDVDVLDIVTQLVDRSLIGVDEAGAERRFRLLETIRAYAIERLVESGEEAVVRGSHFRWCLEMARTAAGGLDGPDRGSWLNGLEREHGNLRAALAWSAVSGAASEHVELIASLGCFWFFQAHLDEGRCWLDAALPAESESPAIRAALLRGAGIVARAQGAYDDADRALGKALCLVQSIGDDRMVAAVLADLGRVALRRGDYGGSTALLERSLTLDRAGGRSHRANETLSILATVARLEGDPTRAVRTAEAALAEARALGAGWLVGMALRELGAALLRLDDGARAEIVLEEAMVHRSGTGNRRGALEAVYQLTVLALRRGDAARARALLRSSLAEVRAIGSGRDAVQQLEAAGWLAQLEHRPQRAARLLAAGDALRRAIGLAVPPVERVERKRVLAAVRAELTPRAFTTAWRAGEGLGRDEAMAFASVAADVDEPASTRPAPGATDAARDGDAEQL